MFEIGFPELMLIAVVGLLVIGPERLPETLRTLGLWFGRMRRSFTSVKAEIEKEIGMDEVKRQLHNEAIMEEMRRIESEVKDTAQLARTNLDEGARAADMNPPPPSIDPNVGDNVSDMLAAQDGMLPNSPEAELATGRALSESEQEEQDLRDHSDAADNRDHIDAADDRDHSDAAEDRDHSDAADDRDHSDAGDDRVPVAATVTADEDEARNRDQVKNG
ncbi:MAG: Sec-independent protein translocase protein TatB [Pseudomonadota bacterium]